MGDVDAERQELLGQPWSVLVGDPPGQYLGPGHDDSCTHAHGVEPSRQRPPQNGARRSQSEATDWSIDAVAFACGFTSAVTFRQNFGAAFAVTPTAYRRQFAPAPPVRAKTRL
ncbi:helix-turn-helix domain-containing protein [Rhodococcus indonesiensis]|uniref:helix-turn-helix domain-containing protein n=1 Tax=Rhodococcus indonesiensis TaxID=3055869 RepID=UPI0039F649A5